MAYWRFAKAPATIFSAAFEREAGSETGKIVPVLELTIPSGEVLRYASTGASSDLHGPVQNKVTSFGRIVQAVSDRNSRLSRLEATVEIADTDRTFAQAVYQRHRNSYRGSPVRISLMSLRVPPLDSFVAFSGILRTIRPSGPFKWKLLCGANDTALRNTDFPRLKIKASDWPKAKAEVLGEGIPAVLGVHSSASLTGKGMLPTYLVDVEAFVYLVCLGVAKEVSTVFADGVEVTSGFTVTYPVVNGIQVTCLDFTSNQGAAAITVDMEGLTDQADGTGSLVTNPADQLALLLRLWVWNDWRSGPYPDTEMLDATSFADTAEFLALMGYEGSAWIGGTTEISAGNLLSKWCDSHEAKPYWTFDGKLAVGVLDHRAGDGYPELWVRQEDHQAAFQYGIQDADLTREIVLNYLFGQVEKKPFYVRRIQDISVEEQSSKTRSLEFSKAAL